MSLMPDDLTVDNLRWWRDAESQRLPTEQEEISTAHAVLSIADRVELDTGGQTLAGLIRERYGLEPENYEDAEELRAAIVAQGGYRSGNVRVWQITDAERESEAEE